MNRIATALFSAAMSIVAVAQEAEVSAPSGPQNKNQQGRLETWNGSFTEAIEIKVGDYILDKPRLRM